MTKTTPARERVLDAFENLLITVGERGATLDSTASAAGVSKGGLLYHFGNRDTLVAGLLDRMRVLAAEDLEHMRTDPAGPVDYLLRTSYDAGEPFDRAVIAVTRLAQSDDPRAAEALGHIRDRMMDELRRVITDPALTETIMLISDGMYHNSAIMDPGNPNGPGLVPVADVIACVQPLLDQGSATAPPS